MQDKIIIKGARENNLKDVNLEFPKNKLVVFSGVSGCGKSSLAFDTIYAEGQRRYVESLSAYARQFLGNSEKPDVDLIEGLLPAIAIDQKTTNNNPRSTVGTVTEIYDYLRLLYARVGVPYCPNHHIPITSMSVKKMVEKIEEISEGTRLVILAPIAKNSKGTFKDTFDKLKKDGFVRVEVDNEIFVLDEIKPLEKNNKHNINVVIDRLVKKEENQMRYMDSIETALKYGNGVVIIKYDDQALTFSSNYSCIECGFSITELEPRLFSFNAPIGACEHCKGIGSVQSVDNDFLIPDASLSINEGGIAYYKNLVNTDSIEWQNFKSLMDHYHVDGDCPINKLPKKQLEYLLVGSDEPISYTIESKSGNKYIKKDYIEGVSTLILRRYHETTSQMSKDWYAKFLSENECPVCHGDRLNPMALSVLVGKKNIADFTKMSIKEALHFINSLKLSVSEQEISRLIIKEIKSRLQFLVNVGLEYLSLNRIAGTLSGGESQRIRLATQIGTSLTGVLYVLDEPSIGLHQKDNDRLIATLKQMRDLGNTLVVVEHDEDTLRASDYIVDIGPKAGEHGGEIIYQGDLEGIMNCEQSITGQYLSGKKQIVMPHTIRKGNGNYLKVVKAKGNNLKNVSVKIPLGTFTCVSGVSGSGKSTLVNEIIGKAVALHLGRSKVKPLEYQKIEGLEHIDKLVVIDQKPIGKTPRSNPATYTGVFDDIRDLFALTPTAKLKGYDKGRFSFNVRGGRCEACQGDGVRRISMHFLPDVYVQCEECHGQRYNDATLEVTYKGLNISQVLDLTVEKAIDFFSNIHKIKRQLQVLDDVGLGYIRLGQAATTLSGGEAQRIKLAFELQKRATGKTLFILDEPTTGLHSDDVNKLIQVIQKIADNGDSVIVIEHNLDVLKCADYIIDMGPNGGDDGGKVIFSGTINDIINCKESYTGAYLHKIIKER
ncbi:MAG: excinuclease ABC subunit UvrA [Erysipelotrichaceae bacterium]